MSDLTAQLLREVLNYDPETGLFTWANPPSRKVKRGTVAGSMQVQGYARVKLFKKEYLQHRLAWLYVHGSWPKHEIDHINGNRSDNRIRNLRDVPKAFNMQNRRAANRTNMSTGVLGVTYRPKEGVYAAKIGISGRRVSLGLFKTVRDAQAAYLEAKKSLHPGAVF